MQWGQHELWRGIIWGSAAEGELRQAGCCEKGGAEWFDTEVVSYLFILNPYLIILLFHWIVFGNKWLTYIGEDAVALVAHTSLQTEGQVMAADHDAAAKALLKRLHIRLDAWEVQPLHDNRGTKGNRHNTKEKTDRREERERRQARMKESDQLWNKSLSTTVGRIVTTPDRCENIAVFMPL